MSSFSQITLTPEVLNLYKIIFPTVSDPNGLFGDRAEWYGIKTITGEVIAFYTIGQIENRPDSPIMLYNVGVSPHHRHQGHGQQLIKNLLKMYGDREIFLFVNPSNKEAMSLYKRFKFREAKRAYVPPKGEICLWHHRKV